MRNLAVVMVLGACGGAQTSTLPVTRDACFSQAQREQPQPPAMSEPLGAVEVPVAALEAHRIAGEKHLMPDDDTRDAVYARHLEIAMEYRLCVGPNGVPITANLRSPSCYPRYEASARDQILAWRFSPYEQNGGAVPVCTVLTVRYTAR